MSDAIRYQVKTAAGTFDVEEFARRARKVWDDLPGNVKDRVLRGFGQWIHKIVVDVKANRLKGQVLAKRSGTLYDTFHAQMSHRDARATFFETAYGRMWEHTGHGVIVPVNGCQCAICRKSAVKWLHWKSFDGRWVRVRSVKAVAAKPHIQPSVAELAPERRKLVLEPLVRAFVSAFRSEKGSK